ncbi:MAG: SDR family NAD(P)-dependent oxidoreductase [Pseudomonadota bacterium]
MAYSGKLTLVTGGGSGMGRVAARNCAGAGAAVAIIDLNEAGMMETAQAHESIRYFKVDITDGEQVKETVAQIERDMGDIDRVYNAAGIMPFGKLLEMDAGVVRKIMDVNYGGLVNVAQAALPAMVARGRGEFISFASMAGWFPLLLTGAYNASKFAVVAFTEVLYHENRDSGVQFACVCPNVVKTPLLQQARDTAWPKMMDSGESQEPEQILDAIERSLEKGEFWVFPSKDARLGWKLRRWLPNLMWKQVHKTEGW